MSFILLGPFALNGVPLRRVNQAYVIATSTKVDLTSVDVKSIDDTFFAREKSSKKSSVTDLIADKVSNTLTETRKNAQVAVDGSLIANIKKVEFLDAYLKAKFSLRNSDKPHLLKF